MGHEVDVSITDLVADVRAATPSHAAELVVPERDAIQGYVDELSERLFSAMTRGMEGRRERLARITLRTPAQRIADGRLRLDEVSDRLFRGADTRLTEQRNRLAHLGGRLDAMSPLRVLERGYVVVQGESGAVTSASSLESGAEVRLRFHDGHRSATITGSD